MAMSGKPTGPRGGGRQWRQSFVAEVHSVAAARRFVCDALVEIGSLGLMEDAELLVSELATNAVIHGGGAFDVVVRASSAGLWVAVTDLGQPGPWAQRPDSLAERGRGLWLVDCVADRWGVDPVGDDRKTVWFWIDSGRADRRPTTSG